MNKMDYEKAITEAKDKGELIGVIIAFSQDTSLPWATFRKYYNQAHLRMLTNSKKNKQRATMQKRPRNRSFYLFAFFFKKFVF